MNGHVSWVLQAVSLLFCSYLGRCCIGCVPGGGARKRDQAGVRATGCLLPLPRRAPSSLALRAFPRLLYPRIPPPVWPADAAAVVCPPPSPAPSLLPCARSSVPGLFEGIWRCVAPLWVRGSTRRAMCRPWPRCPMLVELCGRCAGGCTGHQQTSMVTRWSTGAFCLQTPTNDCPEVQPGLCLVAG